MPSLRDIRKRIGSVRSTQKITRAMKMVAASKLRRAQDAIMRARPYAQLLETALRRIAAGEEISNQPLLSARPIRKVELVVITSNRGLAGAFNSNILRKTQRYLYETAPQLESVVITTIGRKARDFFKGQRSSRLRKDYSSVLETMRFEQALEISQELTQRFISGEVDQVLVIYNEFKSAIAQTVTTQQLLPLQAVEGESEASKVPAISVDVIYEPSRDAILAELLPKHFAIQIWRALLESIASEHGARMTAMESASKNAKDMIGSLTLQFNRARQAYITKELMEIVGGSEALK